MPSQKYRKNKWLTIGASGLVLAGAVLVFWPDAADARVGGGSSTGSRGSRTQSAPRQTTAPAQQSISQKQGQNQSHAQEAPRPQPAPGAAAPTPPRPGFGGALMGGIGGFMLGGMLGSMLFGGHGGGGGGGGFGFIELLLLGGVAYLLYRVWRNWQAAGGGRPTLRKMGSPPFSLPRPEKALPAAFASGKSGTSVGVDTRDDLHLFQSEPDLSQSGTQSRTTAPIKPFSRSDGPVLTSEEEHAAELSHGLHQITLMDPRFREDEFLAGACVAFELLQGAWRDWNVDQLRPLVTDRMWALVARQALDDKNAGRRNVIEKINFESSAITEAWQESGEDFITVRFDVSMVDYITDTQGKVIEGDPVTPIRVEEYWTFVRPVGAPDPNWRLSAIQQPGAGIATPS
ncbi:MAG: Tim44 domain-containing protein [Magnetococcales bacterium]|nr:Tim44 domain-containing protein [Magnetococcales bacterium]